MMKEKKGKNFSCNNLGQRKKSDFYETPYSITRQLLEVEDFSECATVLEPACGNGAISGILSEVLKNTIITSSDLSQGINFLSETNLYDGLITNPPFSLAKEFILKAKEVTRQKFAMLLPLSYLHGEDRYNTIYQDRTFPLKTIYVFTRYPMLRDKLRPDGKYRTGMMVYCWYVWDKNCGNSEPTIQWISNQKYVLKKGD